MDADAEQALATALAGLATLVLGDRPLERTLLSIAVFATAAIPGADGTGLTLLEHDRPRATVADADFVSRIEEVQERLGEGPGLRALEDRATQVTGSLGGEARWPRFGPRAGRLGVHSALALPLLVERRAVGALNVYGHGQHCFDERSVRVGEHFSGPAAVTAANALLLEESRRVVQQLERALASRTVIDQAIGILMSRSGGTSAEAFEHLRQTSQAGGTKLADVARGIVAHAVSRARARHQPSGARPEG